MNEFLKQLCENLDYRAAIKEVAQHAPLIPEYNQDKDNVEEWKSKCAERRGFKLCLMHLGFKLEDL